MFRMVDVNALVDSGAEHNVFSIDIARRLHLDVKTGQPVMSRFRCFTRMGPSSSVETSQRGNLSGIRIKTASYKRRTLAERHGVTANMFYCGASVSEGQPRWSGVHRADLFGLDAERSRRKYRSVVVVDAAQRW